MEKHEIRSQQIDGLRAMADFFESNPHLPLAYSITVSHYTEEEESRNVRRGIYGWEKQTSESSEYINYVQDFTPQLAGYHKVTYQVVVDKTQSQTCKRVQVGTRHVPAQEAYEEPIYTWDCSPAEDSDDDLTNAQAALAAEIDSDRSDDFEASEGHAAGELA